jgi:8-oxo-dGTP pyrophosphatase MutT (NUDIX family)
MASGSLDMSSEISAASTVVIVRDGGNGIESLLLRRHSQLKVSGGHWVFPGGRIDPEDYQAARDDEHAARIAGVRETHEESGLVLNIESLLFLSHWTTPPSMGRRFATWFYLAEVNSDFAEVLVDGQEMDDFCWARPADFLDRHRQGELALLPPTVVTLEELHRCGDVAAAQRFYRERPVPYIAPLITQHNDTVCMLYAGDAGYENSDPEADGTKNRCYLESGVWRYEFHEG